jgi:hypothetical protein
MAIVKNKIMKSILLFMVTIISCTSNTCPSTTKNFQLPLKYSGAISKKFIDSTDRNQPRIIINDQKYTIDNIDAFNKMEIGDTIIKDSGTLKYVVKKYKNQFDFYPRCAGIDVTE